MKPRPQVRLLPILILVAFLSLTVRMGEFITGFRHFSGEAGAQEKVDGANPPPLPAVPGEEKPPAEPEKPAADAPGAKPSEAAAPGEAAADAEDEKKPEAEKTEKAEAGHDAAAKKDAKDEKEVSPPEWKDATDNDFDYSQIKMELFQDLTKRRKELEEREKTLASREALLQAGEKELDQKFREMESLKADIQEFMKQQSEEEKARVASLVKIYEGMKAKDAARIFNTLDIDVLMAVMTRMSERKTAPILAQMESERAKSVTFLMAQQKKLPDLAE